MCDLGEPGVEPGGQRRGLGIRHFLGFVGRFGHRVVAGRERGGLGSALLLPSGGVTRGAASPLPAVGCFSPGSPSAAGTPCEGVWRATALSPATAALIPCAGVWRGGGLSTASDFSPCAGVWRTG